MAITIQPVNPLSNTRIVWDTAVGAMDTVPSLTVANAYKGETVWLSAVVTNDAADAEYTVEVTLSGLTVETKYVLCFIRGTNGMWTSHTRGGEEPTVVKPDGELCPVLLTNDPHLVRTVVDPDPKESHSYVKVTAGEHLITERLPPDLANERKYMFDDPNIDIQEAATLQPVTLTQDRNQQILMQIRIPEGQAAGEYTGTLDVKLAGVSQQTANITVTVANHVYVDTDKMYRLFYTAWYRSIYDTTHLPTLHDEAKSTPQIQKDFKWFVDNKTTIVDYTYYDANGDGGNTFGSNEDFITYLTMKQAAGMPIDDFYTPWLSTAGADTQEKIDDVLRQISEINVLLEPFGSPQLWVYAQEEVGGGEADEQRECWRQVRATGTKIFTSSYASEIASFEGDIDLINVISIGTPALVTEIKDVQNSLATSYALPQTGAESPYIYRRNYGLMTWAGDFDGVMNYAFQNTFGYSWNDMDWPPGTISHLRPHYFAFPATTGAIPTLSSAGWFAAQQDMAIVQMLERAIERFPELPEAVTAQAFLDAKRSELQANTSQGTRPVWDYDANVEVFVADAKAHYEAIDAALAVTLDNPTNTPTIDGAVIGCTTDDTSGIAYAMVRTDRQWYSVANGDSQALADADKTTIIVQDITAPELVWAGTDEDLATIQLTIDGLAARLDPANPYYIGWVQTA